AVAREYPCSDQGRRDTAKPRAPVSAKLDRGSHEMDSTGESGALRGFDGDTNFLADRFCHRRRERITNLAIASSFASVELPVMGEALHSRRHLGRQLRKVVYRI